MKPAAGETDHSGLAAGLEHFPEEVQKLLRAVSGKADFPLRAARLAVAMRDRAKEKHRQWEELALWARELAPDDPQVRDESEWALRKRIPDWHFRLVHDSWRNDLYARALRRFVTPASTVLEIGTGSGILAMLAAKAGAQHVYTCEMEPLLAKAARDNIAGNGFADKITVLDRKSTDVRLGRDLPHRANLFVSEIVDNGLLAEDVLPLMEDAMERLLTPDAVILPSRIASVGVLVGGGPWCRNCRVGTVSGFDLSALNRYSPPICSISFSQLADGLAGALHQPLEIFHFDFQVDRQFPEEKKTVTVTAGADGLAEGFLTWIRLRFAEDIVLENRPPQESVWAPRLHVFPQPVPVEKGQAVSLVAQHDRQRILVWPAACGG